MNRVVTVHGWYGHPTDGWWPWLIEKLNSQGCETVSPQMPDTENPKAMEWVVTLNKSVPNPSEDDFFVGHSLGCITILRYLEQLASETKVGGVVLVAGFTQDLHFKGYENELSTFFEQSLNWDAIKSHCANFWVISSDDDQTVDGTNHERLRNSLDARETWEHNKHHMTGDDGVFELPSVLEALKTFMS